MTLNVKLPLAAGLVLLLVSSAVLADSVTLNGVQFPEGRETDIDLEAASEAAPGRIHGEVEFEDGKAEIRLKTRDVAPALALGGDVHAYVVWAVPRRGAAENLGELPVRRRDERFEFTSGLKEFALIVTGEEHPQVQQPSSLMLFSNQPVKSRRARNVPFAFEAAGDAPAVAGSRPLPVEFEQEGAVEVMQAHRIFALAEARDGERHAPELMSDARVALGQADTFLSKHRERQAIDYARRATSLASQVLVSRDEALARHAEAAREAERQALSARAEVAERQGAELRQELVASEREKRDLERRIDQRQAQLSELRRQAAELEGERVEAQQRLQLAEEQLLMLDTDRRDARQEAHRLETEREQLSAFISDLAAQQAKLRAQQDTLLAAKQQLEVQNQRLAQEKTAAELEKQALASQASRAMADLEGALSEIAETRTTARGLVVSLPDILFDVDKASLRHDDDNTLARLAGVLILVPDLELSVEGHTDSTGSVQHNDWLSRARAETVAGFLVRQGVDESRLSTRGFGEHQPIADNGSRQGRQRNRRVEVVIERDSLASLAPQ